MAPRLDPNFWNNVNVGTPDECWTWKRGACPNGYGQIVRDKKRLYPHREAYELAKGKIPAGFYVCHSCDNKLCCNPNHLFLGTQAENIRDAAIKGLMKRKLTNEEVRTIRRLDHEGITQTVIAERFGVCQQTISNIVRRAGWQHVE